MNNKNKKDIILFVNEIKPISIRTNEKGQQAIHPHTNEEMFGIILNGICIDANNEKKVFDDDIEIQLTTSDILMLRNMLNEVIEVVYPDEMSDVFIN